MDCIIPMNAAGFILAGIKPVAQTTQTDAASCKLLANVLKENKNEKAEYRHLGMDGTMSLYDKEKEDAQKQVDDVAEEKKCEKPTFQGIATAPASSSSSIAPTPDFSGAHAPFGGGTLKRCSKSYMNLQSLLKDYHEENSEEGNSDIVELSEAEQPRFFFGSFDSEEEYVSDSEEEEEDSKKVDEYIVSGAGFRLMETIYEDDNE